MDILDQLHGAHWADASERLRLVNLAADEIERLREALEYFTCDCRGDNCKEPYHDCGRVARDALKRKK